MHEYPIRAMTTGVRRSPSQPGEPAVEQPKHLGPRKSNIRTGPWSRYPRGLDDDRRYQKPSGCTLMVGVIQWGRLKRQN